VKAVITILVAVHFAVIVWHGNAHQRLGITLPPEKNVFVYVVIVVAPIIATLLAWTRYRAAGAWVLFLSMLGALLFGAYHHYVLVSPDNIHHLPDGSGNAQFAFSLSAAAMALSELAAATYGAFCVGALGAGDPQG
jgi:hypothetical protein